MSLYLPQGDIHLRGTQLFRKSRQDLFPGSEHVRNREKTTSACVPLTLRDFRSRWTLASGSCCSFVPLRSLCPTSLFPCSRSMNSDRRSFIACRLHGSWWEIAEGFGRLRLIKPLTPQPLSPKRPKRGEGSFGSKPFMAHVLVLTS